MVVAPAARHDDGVSHPDDPQRPSIPARFRPALAGVLAVLLAVGIIWLVVALIEREPFGDDDETSAQATREVVMSRAETFVVLSFTYDKDDLDENGELSGYQEELEPLLTSEAMAELPEQAAGLAQLIAEENWTRSTQIEAVGVQSLDDDSAEVIVAGIFTESRRKVPTSSARFQMVVDLDKVDGEWLVNDFARIGEEETP